MKIIENLLPIIWDDLTEKSKELIKKQEFYIDSDGEPVTSIVNGKRRMRLYLYLMRKGNVNVRLKRLFS